MKIKKSNYKKTLVILLAVLFALSAALTGCGGGAEEKAPAGDGQAVAEPIKIGVTTPLSAPGDTAGGTINKNTLELAKKEINDAGGVDGRLVELVIGDDAGDTAQGVSLIQKFANENKVSAILGAWHGSVAQAQSVVATENKVPFMLHYSWSDEITAAHSDYVFRVSPYNSQIANLLVPYIKENGYQHVAVVAEDSSYGTGFADALAAEGEKNGFKVTVRVISSQTIDPSPQLLELKNMNPQPDLLVVASVYQPMYTIPKQARAVGLECQIMAGWDYPSWDAQFWPNVGSAGVGILYPSFYAPTMTLSDLGKNFKAAYTEAYGEEPPIYAYFLYDEFLMVMDAIKNTGSSDPQAIADYLKDISFEGTTGTIEFAREDSPGPVYNQWMGHQIFIFQLQNEGDMGDKAVLVN